MAPFPVVSKILIKLLKNLNLYSHLNNSIVADEKNNDKFTANIREFNKFVSEDKRVEQIIVPLGDGMTVCRVL